MKVDIQRMDDAYIQMKALQRQLSAVENRIQKVMHVLAQQSLGGEAQTAEVIAFLASQRESLDRRAESVRQLAQALQSACDQYRQCEAEAGRESEHPADTWSRSVADPFEGISFVQPRREKEIIHQYIMPLLAAGKDRTI